MLASGPNEIGTLVTVHAVAMALAWLIIVPISSLSIGKDMRRKWFPRNTNANPRHSTFHKYASIAVLTISTIGFIIGFFFISTFTNVVHLVLGSCVLVLMLVQGSLGFWRTNIYPVRQGAWLHRVGRPIKGEIVKAHRWVGKLAWLIAAVNVFFGFAAYPAYGIICTVVAGVLIAIGSCMMFYAVACAFFKRNEHVKPVPEMQTTSEFVVGL